MKNKGLILTIQIQILLGVSLLTEINGINDANTQYPYIVILFNKPRNDTESSCTGSLLNPYWVLTSGRCVDSGPPIVATRYRNYTEYIDERSGHYFSAVRKAFKHPDYWRSFNGDQIKNDIALIHIEKYPSSEYATLQMKPVKDMMGTKVTIAGFGRTPIRLASNMKTIATEKVQTGNGKIVKCSYVIVAPQLCVTPKISQDSKVKFSGDAGEPCFVDNKIAGVLTGNLYRNNDIVSLFTPVESFVKWIKSVTETGSLPNETLILNELRSYNTNKKPPFNTLGSNFRFQKTLNENIRKPFKVLWKLKAVKNRTLLVSHGVDDIKNQYPYVVLLADKPSDSGGLAGCSGSLLNPFWVLTAGHCVDPGPPKVATRYRNYTKYLNATGHYFSKVLKVFAHPQYSRTNHMIKNDIALILIEKYPCPKYGTIETEPVKDKMGTAVTFAGFGRITPWMATIPAPENKPIRAEVVQLGYGKIFKCTTNLLAPQLCIGPDIPDNWDLSNIQTTRPGDSGGPCFVDNKIVALVSGHYHGETNPVSSFTPVENFLEWIKNVMDENSKNQLLAWFKDNSNNKLFNIHKSDIPQKHCVLSTN